MDANKAANFRLTPTYYNLGKNASRVPYYIDGSSFFSDYYDADWLERLIE